MATKQRAVGIPTIDVALVVIRTNDLEIAIDTASKVGVEPQTETQEAIKLVKLGKLIAQKPEQTTITGHKLVLTDNVFTPVVAHVLQGGTLGEADANGFQSYQPPVAGSTDKGKIFETDMYSAVYDASGQIIKYEVITYPNCQGTPFAINTEDNVFRVSEYTINSAPKKGEAPYNLEYVDALPVFN